MACSKFSQTVATACRDSQPGLKNVWLANYSDITAFALDTAKDICSGITFSGSTKFYKLALNKQVGVVADAGSISIANGTAICKPSLSFKVQGWSATVRKIYEQLLQATVVAVAEAMDGTYWIFGLNNGLDATELSYGTESDPTGFKGLSVKLEGIEPAPFYQFTVDISTVTT